MALDMLEEVRTVTGPDGSSLKIRIGVHSGVLAAGVIGRNRLRYNIWGETVNIANCLEAKSRPMAVHVSEASRKYLRDVESSYTFQAGTGVEYNSNKLDTYFVARKYANRVSSMAM
mmetsp:Transcript_13206/g.34619  ORF Transcript_13206/g.34619 Transcript_13206/m.34619 type:complete len:116 (-) Transcript_13206:357-704(-)